MCQSKAEGGQRCGCDSSPQRRMRRKASDIRTEGQTSPVQSPHADTVPVAKTSFQSFAELKQAIVSLKQEMHNAPTDPVERSAYDERMEVKMSAIGDAVAAEAEKLAGYDEEAIAEQITEKTRSFEAELTRTEKILNDSKNKTNIDNHEIVKEEIEKARRHYSEYIAQAKQNILTTASKKLSESYIQVIAQIRPTGGEVNLDPQSDPDAVELLNKTVVQNYPTEWIEMHNKFSGEQMRVNNLDEGRPGYIRGYTADEIDFNRYSLKNLSEETIAKYQTAFGDKFQEIKYFKKPEGVDNAYRILHNGKEEVFSRLKHGAHKENDGWEYRATCNVIETRKYKKIDKTPAAVDMLVKPTWVRNSKEVKQPELNIYSLSNLCQDVRGRKIDFEAEVEGIAYHEFGHRMEHVFTGNLLARQEKAFLKRRSGKTDKTFHDNLHYVNPLKAGTLPSELYHNGNFVTQYTGREYYDPNEQAYEVFTTGIQALYAHRYGGLLGNDAEYFQADREHRAFTLGALATL
jgi:hypothetical protein